MKRLKKNIWLMVVFLVVSILIVFLLESTRPYIHELRNLIGAKFPIVKVKSEFISNFSIGIFSTALMAIFPLLIDFRSERDSSKSRLIGFVKSEIRPLLENLATESLDQIKELHKNGKLQQMQDYLLEWKGEQKQLKKSIKKDKFRTPEEYKFLRTLHYIYVYYNHRLLIGAHIESCQYLIKNTEKMITDSSSPGPIEELYKEQSTRSYLTSEEQEAARLQCEEYRQERINSLPKYQAKLAEFEKHLVFLEQQEREYCRTITEDDYVQNDLKRLLK